MCSRLRVCLRALLIVVSVAVAPSPLFAQATGQIMGVVSDASGSVVPGATIEVVSQATGQMRTGVTGTDGFYNIPQLNPGLYQVKAILAGFRTSIRDRIDVVVNESVRADLQLQVGEVSEQVDVSAASPLVDTSNATLGIVIDRQKVVDLPLNGRNFTQLGTLIPGVVAPPGGCSAGQDGNATPGGFGNVTGGFNVNGMRNQSNNFLLDGASNNDSFNTGFVLRPPPDAIQEFKILTHSYDAEYGRNAGSIVNVVTQGRQQRLAAAAPGSSTATMRCRRKNYFAHDEADAETEPVRRRDRRADPEEPVVRVRLLRGVQATSRAQPTRAPCCRRRSATATSRRRRDSRSAHRAAVSRQRDSGQPDQPDLHADSRQLHSAAEHDAQPLTRSPNVEDTREQFGHAIRLPRERPARVLGRYIVGHTDNVNPLGGSNFSPAGNMAMATLQDLMGSDTWIVKPNMINVARVSLQSHLRQAERDQRASIRATSGWIITPSNPTAAGLPYITMTGFFTTGDAQQPFANRANNVFGFTDDFNWVAGRHSMKFGGEMRRDQISSRSSTVPTATSRSRHRTRGTPPLISCSVSRSSTGRRTGDPNMDGSSLDYASTRRTSSGPGRTSR